MSSMQVDQARLPQLSQLAQDEQAPLVEVVHSTKVNAVHRLWSPSLTEQGNLDRYGSATALHGHEYTFKIKFRGPVNKVTGEVTAAELLEDVVVMAVTEVLDRKNLDNDISFFLSRPSTLENVCLFAFRNIGVIMRPHPFSCTAVTVETSGCHRSQASKHLTSTSVTYAGEMMSAAPAFTENAVLQLSAQQQGGQSDFR
ncbi:hypothetical protein OIO90_004384 [Microbotryomycetes sp. JL221]|nr:hypothetical protein OIO90_004384 [Microbotryomycetes sp. JL221]